MIGKYLRDYFEFAVDLVIGIFPVGLAMVELDESYSPS